VSQIRTLTPNFTVVTLKCGLTAPKSPNLVIFGINLSKRGIPPSAIFTKFRLGEGLPGLHLHAKIYRCGFKYVPPKSIICAPKGYIYLSNFYRIWPGVSHVPIITLTFTFVALKCGLTAVKIAKNSNFWYKFAPKKKSRASIEKLEYRCTTRNLPLCNSTIILLKITLLHSVSVITNFVIPKRDKQTDRQKNHTFSSTAGARPTIPTVLSKLIEKVRPVFAPPNFFGSNQ